MSGSLLGGTIIGFVAAQTGPQTAMTLGGGVGIVGIVVLIIWLQQFWKHKAGEMK